MNSAHIVAMGRGLAALRSVRQSPQPGNLMRNIFFPAFLFFLFVFSAPFAREFEKDVFETSEGDLSITFIGHGSLMLEFGGKVIHVDPWSKLADYTRLPKADLVLITHHHIDHLDTLALRLIIMENTVMFGPEMCAELFPGIKIMRYGDNAIMIGLPIETVPAYNIPGGKGRPAHPYGVCNGYIVTFGDLRVYFAGETELIPEMSRIKDIDILFLAMDGIYNMTPETAAEAAKTIRPNILYPIHFAKQDPGAVAELLRESGIEVRIRKME